MKAFFIFRDGELFGSPIGYTTIKGAQKSLIGCEDWHRLLSGRGSLDCEPPEEEKEWYKKVYLDYFKKDCWFFEREIWSRKVWNPYVKEHYKIIEKEFDIVFRD